jgi:site-specific DNA-cytosine methylase
MQDRVFHEEGKSHSLTASFASRTNVGKFEVKSYREVRTEDAKKARREHREKTGDDHTPFRAKELVEREDGKTGTITPSHHKGLKVSVQEDGKKLSWRKLTPLECERLQTVPDGYTLVMEDGKQKVSNSQRYKMLGNGWTVDVITHILKNMQ